MSLPPRKENHSGVPHFPEATTEDSGTVPARDLHHHRNAPTGPKPLRRPVESVPPPVGYDTTAYSPTRSHGSPAESSRARPSHPHPHDATYSTIASYQTEATLAPPGGFGSPASVQQRPSSGRVHSNGSHSHKPHGSQKLHGHGSLGSHGSFGSHGSSGSLGSHGSFGSLGALGHGSHQAFGFPSHQVVQQPLKVPQVSSNNTPIYVPSSGHSGHAYGHSGHAYGQTDAPIYIGADGSVSGVTGSYGAVGGGALGGQGPIYIGADGSYSGAGAYGGVGAYGAGGADMSPIVLGGGGGYGGYGGGYGGGSYDPIVAGGGYGGGYDQAPIYV